MIYISFSLSNPFCKPTFKGLVSSHGLLATNKAWEAESYYDAACLIRFNFSLSIKGDHAGVRIEAGLPGFAGILSLYDTRHWDYENNCWEKQ